MCFSRNVCSCYAHSTSQNPAQKDGGFKSRVAYLNPPFEFVKTPTKPGQRKIDIRVKENIKHCCAEFLFWAKNLAPGLLHPSSRVITPRPTKVQEDVAVQFAAAQPAAVQQSPVELGKAFVEECLVVWDRSAPPSTKPQIN